MSAGTWRGCTGCSGKWWSLHPWRQPESEWNPHLLQRDQRRSRGPCQPQPRAGQGKSCFPHSLPSQTGNAKAPRTQPGSWECTSHRAMELQPWRDLPADHPSPSPPGTPRRALLSTTRTPLTKQDVLPGMPLKEPQEFPDPQAQERLPAPPGTGPSQGGFPGAAKAEFPGSSPGTQRIFVQQRRARQKGVYSGEKQIKKGHFSLQAEQRLLTAAFPCPGPAPAPK